jgi:hypothetical protein
VKLFAFEEYDVYIDGEQAGNTPLRKVSGDYEVAGISVIVLGKRYEYCYTKNRRDTAEVFTRILL